MSLFGSSGRKHEKRLAALAATRNGVSQRTRSGDTTTDAMKRPAKRASGAREGGGEPMATFGKSIIFKGDLSGEEDLEIEGRVEGKIQLPNHQLTIGAHGRVTAQVEAKTVVVIGHVSGNVTATERVEVQASGVVDGDIHAPRLLIQEGAVVNGSIQMGAHAAQGALPQAQRQPDRKTG